MSQAKSGASSTMLNPHRKICLSTCSRSASGALATTSDPLVEKGLESTTEEEIASAAMSLSSVSVVTNSLRLRTYKDARRES